MHAHTHSYLPCRLPEFARWGHQLSLVKGGNPQCCLHDGDELLVLHGYTAVGQSVAMTPMVGPSCQEMFPSGGAESRVPNRGDRAAVRGDDEIKQQNSRVPICVEALLLHNSDRKSHYRRIIAALSLWVLRVVIHSIRPPLFSFSLIRSLLNTLESESILVLFLSRPFSYTSWMCGPCPAGQQMRSLIVRIQISRVGDYWEDELDWVRSLWSQRQDKESLCHLVLVMHLFVSWYCSNRKHENFLQHRWMMLSCCIHSCPTSASSAVGQQREILQMHIPDLLHPPFFLQQLLTSAVRNLWMKEASLQLQSAEVQLISNNRYSSTTMTRSDYHNAATVSCC